MLAAPNLASFGIKNDKIISDCPGLSVVLNEPIPKLVKSESNKLIVTSEFVLTSELRIIFVNPSLPLVNDEQMANVILSKVTIYFAVNY